MTSFSRSNGVLVAATPYFFALCFLLESGRSIAHPIHNFPTDLQMIPDRGQSFESACAAPT